MDAVEDDDAEETWKTEDRQHHIHPASAPCLVHTARLNQKTQRLRQDSHLRTHCSKWPACLVWHTALLNRTPI